MATTEKQGSKPQRERRAFFRRYKDDVKGEGKSFFPYAVFHDTVMSLVVVVVIIVLACIWYFTADGTEAGLLGPWYEEEADPATTDFIPRPDWFFYFLFYLLRIFKWPESVVLATVGIPTAALIALIMLPFYDKNLERRPSRRPVAMVGLVLTIIAMGVLTWKGATAEEALGSELIEAGVPEEWAEQQGFEDNELAIEGAGIYAQSGCLNCHVYAGEGNANLGAPELTDAGASRDAQYFVDYVSNPAAFGNQVMGSYTYLGQENLEALGEFLAQSKGTGG